MTKCKANAIVSAVVLVFVVSFVSADQVESEFDDRPSYWLQKIYESTAKQSYQGTFVYRCDAQLVAMKIIHAANEQTGHERLLSLNGPAHEVIQDGQSITSSLFRGKRTMGVGGNKSIFGPFEKILDAHYKIVEIGEDRIADRHTKVVEIQPKDQYRYGFLIWVDSETGIVLRSDMAGETGGVIEQVMFIDVEMLTDINAERLMGGDATITQESNETADKVMATGDSKWRVGKTPSGFTLSERYLRGDNEMRASQEQLVFTDGLASVSIFIEPRRSSDEPLLGQVRVGAVNVYGKVIDDHQVTVVGDVPRVTVEYIMSSLSLQ